MIFETFFLFFFVHFLIYFMVEAFHLKQLEIASVRPLNIRVTHYNVVTYKIAYIVSVFVYVCFFLFMLLVL